MDASKEIVYQIMLRAVKSAILTVGFENFKKSSFFPISSEKQDNFKKAA
jgi:hypothetical protein